MIHPEYSAGSKEQLEPVALQNCRKTFVGQVKVRIVFHFPERARAAQNSGRFQASADFGVHGFGFSKRSIRLYVSIEGQDPHQSLYNRITLKRIKDYQIFVIA
jgi:hypothetical protein